MQAKPVPSQSFLKDHSQPVRGLNASSPNLTPRKSPGDRLPYMAEPKRGCSARTGMTRRTLLGLGPLAASLLLRAESLSATASPSLKEVLNGIELRYNRLATLQVDFQQTQTYSGRPRFEEQGTLYLRRPSKMRWEYSRPAGKLLVGDGDLLHYYNPRTNQVRQVKPMETGDLRAPLAFLLGRLRFRRQFRNLRLETVEGRTLLAADGRSGKEAYGRVEFTYDEADFRLVHLRILGQDDSITSFHFDDEIVNPRLDPALFDFVPPPGADLLEEAGSLGGQR